MLHSFVRGGMYHIGLNFVTVTPFIQIAPQAFSSDISVSPPWCTCDQVSTNTRNHSSKLVESLPRRVYMVIAAKEVC